VEQLPLQIYEKKKNNPKKKQSPDSESILTSITNLFKFISSKQSTLSKKAINQSTLMGLAMAYMYAYLILVNKSLEAFDCTLNIDGSSTLDADPNLNCYGGTSDFLFVSPAYIRIYKLGIVCTIVYIIIIPSLLFILLYRSRKTLSSADTISTVGFLYCKFQHQYYYWEFIILTRKLLFIIAVLFFSAYQVVQTTGAIFVLFVALLLQDFRPYKRASHNLVEKILLCSSVTILFSSYVLFFFQSANTGDYSYFSNYENVYDGISTIILIILVISFIIAGSVLVLELFYHHSVITFCSKKLKFYKFTSPFSKLDNNSEARKEKKLIEYFLALPQDKVNSLIEKYNIAKKLN